MRYLALILPFSACLVLSGQQVSETGATASTAAVPRQPVPEPQYDNVFAAVDASGKLIPLERQTATIHAGVKAFGYGGIKMSSQFKPGKSPVRFKSGDQVQFVVRSILGSYGNTDPSTVYVLRALKEKGSKRELVQLESHGVLGFGGASANLAEGVIQITFEKWGQHSLKITSNGPIPPGEYALSHRSGMMDLFCFGVDE